MARMRKKIPTFFSSEIYKTHGQLKSKEQMEVEKERKPVAHNVLINNRMLKMEIMREVNILYFIIKMVLKSFNIIKLAVSNTLKFYFPLGWRCESS